MTPPENSAAAQLFDPYTIRDTVFRNRLWVAPMCQYSAEKQDGVPTDWHLAHLGSFASGGVGLIITEATAVNPEGRISPQDLGLYNDEQQAAFERIVELIHSQGVKAGIQLAHAGRKASTYRPWAGEHGTIPVAEGGWRAVAPSAIAFSGYDEPAELDARGIDEVVAAFRASARRAVAAGFDVLELHAAHGYLLHQFLSPLSNTRTDLYGGSLENRARLLLRVVTEIREEVGDAVALFVRLSATDWVEAGGWDVEQTTTVAGWAREAGADFFDISSGGNVAGVTIPLSPGYQVEFAAQVRAGAGVATSAVGLITDAAQADQVITSGQADAVMMAREFLRDPHFALRAAHELGVTLDYWPPQYTRAVWR
ncbi:NADH:flavin oxidoreductase/NADH oxidase [Subtercola endophyticus]|uniref:NADH:flavin oxidoreductase/NADH oxidase n=1 Tax=Subtercola endophyticus TaxID=2895559 RepID=UPI001E47E5C3|nr:NADH:flavin oxidoreductase/NADH oxidase [Subtercola endophyticus]UFS60005.1 NADH:flavin oxidoreductase/NADH oxidase [Subtercola endophyticus]